MNRFFWWKRASTQGDERTLVLGGFDPEWYLNRYSDVRDAGQNPTAHYLTHGAGEMRDPHPLFDTAWYLSTNPDVAATGTNPFLHYIRYGEAEGRRPNLLFDPAWYSLQNSDVSASNVPLLKHYYEFGERENRAPHPFFDLEFYRRRYPDVHTSGNSLLAHFLMFGRHECRQPNPLFSPEWYRKRHPDVAEAGIDPLLHYLTDGVREQRTAHPVFDTAWYVSRYPKSAGPIYDPLSDYLENAGAGTRQPNLLFDPIWYVQRNPDVSVGHFNALEHYTLFGELEGRSPHPLFDVNYYRVTNAARNVRSVGLLEHYLATGRSEDRSPNPVFHPTWYRKRYPDVEQSGLDPVSHYIEFGAAEGRNPSSLFDTEWYRITYLAEVENQTNPLSHYLSKGRRQGHKTNARDSAHKIEVLPPSENVLVPASSVSRKPLVVLITHDCSLTGAPVVLLELARALAALGTLDLFVLGKVGGVLAERFHEVAAFRLLGTADPISELDDCLMAFGRRSIKIALCNTVVTSDLLPILRAHNFWTLSLVHEMPLVINQVGPQSFSTADIFADAVVFGSEFVRSSVIAAYGATNANTYVVPTGYAAKIPSASEVKECRIRLRREADLPEDCIVVVACGTVDHRKGVDLFIQIANTVRSMNRGAIHFVWIGDGPSPYLEMCMEDVRKAGLSQVIRFIGVRLDLERYMPGADLFLLSSREDPFPLVNLAAMAAGVPSLVFKDAGGASEALGDASGLTFDFLDVQAMAKSIVELARDPVERSRRGEWMQNRFTQHYGIETFLDGLSDVLKDIGAQTDLRGFSLEHDDNAKMATAASVIDRGRSSSDVSVVIPSYNHALYITQAIRSVLDQDNSVGELIIIDDHSSDGSDSIIKAALQSYCGPTAIRYERQSRNCGAHATIMRGLSFARGSILTILNSDDVYSADRFSKVLARVPSVGDFLAFSGVDFIDDNGMQCSQNSGICSWYGEALRAATECPTVGFAMLRNNIAVTSGNLVFTRSLYQRIGGFANLKMCHDWEFIMRAIHFVEPIFVSELCLRYRVHSSNTLHSTQHLIREEGISALNNFIELTHNEPSPNRLSPSRLNWPVYFEFFIDMHSSWFAKETIRQSIRRSRPPQPAASGVWQSGTGEIDSLGFLEVPSDEQDALALRRDLALAGGTAKPFKN